MKIGILTYHRAHNYGALLQAFALRTFLRNKGYEVEFVDYWPNYHSEMYKLFSVSTFKKLSLYGKGNYLFKFIICFFRKYKRWLVFLKFINEQLGLSELPRFKNNDSIKGDYDVVVYGSDQIWRKQNYHYYKGFNDVYFSLNLLNAKKSVSYAASMGIINLNQNDCDYLKIALNNFQWISVRELELQVELKKILGQQIHLVIDPVFLLDKEMWSTLIPKRKIKKPYILFYQLQQSTEACKLVSFIRNSLDYDIIQVDGSLYPFQFGKRYHQTESPFEFLSLIKNAEFVVTTSFHGLAFSIIFQKRFYAIGMRNNSGRALSILDILGIKHRYLNTIEKVRLDDEIDYHVVNERLLHYIENSKFFINNSILNSL